MQTDVVYFLMEILWHVELRENSLPEIIFIQDVYKRQGLFQYYMPEGGFMHVAADAGNNGGGAGGIIDGMATEQGLSLIHI